MNNNDYDRHSTFLRNLYSPGFSCILMSYYKTYLSLIFRPFERTDPQTGKDTYSKLGLITTLHFIDVYGLWQACYNMIHKNVQTLTYTIRCAYGAKLTLEKKAPGEIFITLSKNNESVSHKFPSSTAKMKEKGGVETVEVIETGLGVFMKTVGSYLSHINADAHLNKLGDNLAQYQEAEQQEREQRAHAAESSQGNGGQFGNNVNDQAPANNNQYDHASSQQEF